MKFPFLFLVLTVFTSWQVESAELRSNLSQDQIRNKEGMHKGPRRKKFAEKIVGGVMPLEVSLSVLERTAVGGLKVLNAANYDSFVAPGSIVAIGGHDLSQQTAIANARNMTVLGGVKVLMDNKEAELFYVSPTQINAVVPAGLGTGGYRIEVIEVATNRIVASDIFIVDDISPGIFTRDNSGKGVAAALVQDINNQYSFVFDLLTGKAVPIQPSGDVAANTLVLYGTGFNKLNRTQVQARIGGANVQVLYVGPSSYVGLDQINLSLPPSLRESHKRDVDVNLIAKGKETNPVKVQLAGADYSYAFYTSGRYTFTVPTDVVGINMQVWGGTGGDGYECYNDGSWDYNSGESGQYTQGVQSVRAGQWFTVYVQNGQRGGYYGSGGRGADAAVYTSSGNTLYHAYGGDGGYGRGCNFSGDDGATGVVTFTYNKVPFPTSHGTFDVVREGYSYFTVPNGVTGLVVNTFGGGAGGGINVAVIDVKPGDRLTIYIQPGRAGGDVALYDASGRQLAWARGDRSDVSGEVSLSW